MSPTDAPSVLTMPRRGREIIQQAMRRAPHAPGIYRMWSDDDRLLYVGKASSLKKRLAQYCQRSKSHHNRTLRLISETARCDILLTHNEAEALLLESNVIKAHQPRFNVLLRDDKSYPFIHLDQSSNFARLRLHRGARKGRGRFFGPFATSHGVRQTLELLERAFLLRSCPDSVFNNRSRPCLLYQIKRCTAPCVGKINDLDYQHLVQEASSFLSGDSKDMRKKLTTAMNDASKHQQYETAALLRDRIKALSRLESHQAVHVPQLKDADVFALHRDEQRSCIEVFFFRGGRHNGNQSLFPRHDRHVSDEALLAAAITQFYDDTPAPPLLLVSHDISDQHLIEQAHGTHVRRPRRGALRSVMDHALTNARAHMIRHAHRLHDHDYHHQLARLLSLPQVPDRIEIYDNSHWRGSNAVGVMVVADGIGFVTSDYRRFTMRHAKGDDDIGMMREMLTRRCRRLMLVQEKMPAIMMVDGGKAQLHVADQCLADHGLSETITLLAIAKGKEKRDGDETLHSLSHPPIPMNEHNELFAYLRRLRDEAHRYAIGSHRRRQNKEVHKSQLDAIPHIGHKRKKALLHHFGDVAHIARAGVEDLRQVEGISHVHARTIFEWFHQS